MNLRRWSSLILLTGLILAWSPLGALADPPHPHHGWYGPKHYRHQKHVHGWKEPYRHHVYHVYEAPPRVTYVTPVHPLIGLPYQQPYYSPPPPGLSGTIQYNF
jgi:hypothetical protein